MNNMKQTQDDRTIQPFNRSQFTQFASWIIGGSQVKHSAFKLLSQFCRSFDLFTGTCWVRKAHTAHLPKSAFTLAETLIVIGIIGVVAALTLPNLNHATGDKETVTKVKKIYASLNEAFDRAQAVYGPVTEWNKSGNGNDISADDSKRFCKRILEFLKISKQGSEGDDGRLYNIVLADGVEISDIFMEYDSNSTHYPNLKYYGEIYVDLDGSKKGKNKNGYDIFGFDVTSGGIYPSDTEDYSGCFYIGNGMYGIFHYCTRWVLDFGNLDYLKADENGNCNDSNIVLDGVNNTSCH